MKTVRGTLTGPHGEKFAMRLEQPARQTFGRQFMVVFPEILQGIARDPAAPSQTLGVLSLLWTRLSAERWGLIRQAELAEEMGVSQPTVSNAMKYLVGKGLLQKRGSTVRQEWLLAPEAGWKGTPGAYHKAREIQAKGEAKVVPFAGHRARDDDEQGSDYDA